MLTLRSYVNRWFYGRKFCFTATRHSHSNAFIHFFSVEKKHYLYKATSPVSCVKPNASQCEATLCYDVGFPTVYRRIYRRKFLTLSNQTSRYIRECIRMEINWTIGMFVIIP